MQVRGFSTLFVASLVSLAVSAGDDGSVPSFLMECTDQETHAFRHEYHLNEERMFHDRLWSTDEKFNSTWKFRYDAGKKSLRLDQDDLPYDAKALTMIVVEKSEGSAGHSQWTYVLHPLLNKAAAVQVNGFTLLTTGLKARVVEFDCKTLVSNSEGG